MEREVERKQTELINELKNNKAFSRETYDRFKRNISMINHYVDDDIESPYIRGEYAEDNSIKGECIVRNYCGVSTPYRIKVNPSHCVLDDKGFMKVNDLNFYPGEIEIEELIDTDNREKYRCLLVSENLVAQYGVNLLKDYYISEQGTIIKVRKNKNNIIIRYITQFHKYNNIKDSRMYIKLYSNRIKPRQIPVAKILANVYNQVLGDNACYGEKELHTHHVDRNRINDSVGNVVVIPSDYHNVVESNFSNYNLRMQTYRKDVQELLQILRYHLTQKQPLY